MLFTRRAPDDVSRPYLFDRTSPALHKAAPRSHDQDLTERVGVPSRPGARLERDAHAKRACRFGCLKQRVDPYGAGEVLSGPFAGGLCTASFDVHLRILQVIEPVCFESGEVSKCVAIN